MKMKNLNNEQVVIEKPKLKTNNSVENPTNKSNESLEKLTDKQRKKYLELSNKLEMQNLVKKINEV